MATPDHPVETIVGNLAEEALLTYWKDREEAQQPTLHDKYYEKYAGKNCPYRQKFKRPTVNISTLLSTVQVTKNTTHTRPITPSEYGLLTLKTHVDSKTSPHNPSSPLYYTKGEIIVPRWPENKIKINRDPCTSPLAPANPNNSYNTTGRPMSPGPETRHSMRPNSSSGRPRSKIGTRPSSSVNNISNNNRFAPYADLIQSLQANVTDEEQAAINRIQQALLAATQEFGPNNRPKSSRGQHREEGGVDVNATISSSHFSEGYNNSNKSNSNDNNLNSVKSNLSGSFNAAKTITAKIAPVGLKVKKHYNIMEEFLDLSANNNNNNNNNNVNSNYDSSDMLGDFDLDFREEIANSKVNQNNHNSHSYHNNNITNSQSGGFQQLSMPPFDLSRSHYQQLEHWNAHASDIIAHSTLLFNNMYNNVNTAPHNNNNNSISSAVRPHSAMSSAQAQSLPRLTPTAVITGTEDPLEAALARMPSSTNNLKASIKQQQRSPRSPTNITSTTADNHHIAPATTVIAVSHSPNENSQKSPTSPPHQPTVSIPAPVSTRHSNSRPPSASTSHSGRPQSAAKTPTSSRRGSRDNKHFFGSNTAGGAASSPTAAGVSRQTPRDLRRQRQEQYGLTDDPPPESAVMPVKSSDENDGDRQYHHSSHHNEELLHSSDPVEYIDASNRPPHLNPSLYQAQGKSTRKKRQSFDPETFKYVDPTEQPAAEDNAGNNELTQASVEETPMEAIYSVSQQVMAAVHNFQSADPVTVKPKHSMTIDPYKPVIDEPFGEITISPMNAPPKPAKVALLLTEIKLGGNKPLKKTNFANAISKVAALNSSNSVKKIEKVESHLDQYNDFCFDVAKLGIEILSLRDIAMTRAIGRGKFASVYEAQLRSVSRTPNGSSSQHNANSSGLFIGPISAKHTSLNENRETIALKIAQFEGNDPYIPSTTTDDSNAKPTLPPLSSLQEFQRELHALKELAGHRNIVKARGFSISPLGIAMELVEFGNLFVNMNNGEWQAETTLPERLHYMLDVCDGLAHMHSMLFVHRDIKPHNILLGVGHPDGHTICKIADLGTAVKLKSREELLTDQIGTTGYSAPEIFSGKGYSFPVDVFACAVLFWELLGTTASLRNNVLMGKDPSEAVALMESGVRPAFHPDSAEFHKPQLCDIIAKAWSTAPQDRPEIAVLRKQIEAYGKSAY